VRSLRSVYIGRGRKIPTDYVRFYLIDYISNIVPFFGYKKTSPVTSDPSKILDS
jgi:hypothetical protein